MGLYLFYLYLYPYFQKKTKKQATPNYQSSKAIDKGYILFIGYHSRRRPGPALALALALCLMRS